jgi:type I restriction enzyme S subunit
VSAPFKIPGSWAWGTLHDVVAHIEAGKSFTCEPRPARLNEWGVIKVSAMTWGEFRQYENKAVPTDRKINPAYEIRPGDILVSRANTEAYVGAPVLVRECRPRLLLSDKSLRLKPSPEISHDWLLFTLASPYVRNQISALATGSKDSMRNISQQALLGVRIAIPPLLEQRRIVAELGDYLSRLSVGVSIVEAAQVRLSRFKEAVFAAAINGELSERAGDSAEADCRFRQVLAQRQALVVSGKRGRPEPSPPCVNDGPAFPEQWARLSMEQVTDPTRTISYGILKPGPNLPDGIPYIRVVNMRGDRISVQDLHRTSREIDTQYSRARLREGDVLISIRGTYGRVAIVPPELEGANITQDTARLAFLDGIDPNFACIYLRSPQVQRHLQRVARGVAVKGVNIGDLREMPFPVPSVSEQREIVNRVGELISEQEAATTAVRREAAYAKALRASLLGEAFAGRLIPQNLGDEPASELVARIRAKRAAVPTKGKRAVRTAKPPPPITTTTYDDYHQEELPL